MSEQQKTLERPRQVTLAAGIIVIGSIFVVLSIWDQISGLRSLSSLEQIEKFLSEPPGDRIGMGVNGVVETIRITLMVAAGCATAAAILGVHVWKRNRKARLALTILAVPLFLTGLLTATFLCSAVAAAAAMLWLQPARDWFDGRPPAVRPDPTRRDTPAPELPGEQPTGRPLPPPWVPPSGHEPQAYGAPQLPPSPYPFGHPAFPPQGVLPQAPVRRERPTSVTVACVIAWVSSGAMALMMGAVLLMLATAPESIFDEVHRQNPDLDQQGISDAMLRSGSYVLGALVLVWCVATVVFALFVFRRRRWAWIALLSSTIGVLVASLLMAAASVVMVLPALAAGLTVIALLRPESKAWFAAAPTRTVR